MVDCLTQELEDQALTDLPEEVLAAELEVDKGESPRNKASAILRRLKETGWIDVETRLNFEQFVNLADYAIKVLDTLDKIRKQRPTEYQGYVYGTYAALSIEDVERQGALALEAAYELTEALIRELKSLNHNIKKYMEKLLQEKRPQDVLATHFLEYQPQVLDRSYHYLKTSDNVSRYRPRILQRIEQWLKEPGWVMEVARSGVQRGKYQSEEEAKEEIYRQLHFIRTSYLNMDDLLEEIDRRNAQYARASVEKLRYLLNSSRDTEGQLVELLKFMGYKLVSQQWGKDESLNEEWQKLFSLFTQAYLAEESLFTPRQRKRLHQPAELTLAELTPRHKALYVEKVLQNLESQLTPPRIEAYVKRILEGRQAITAAEMKIDTIESFVRLIYIAAYASRKRSFYTVEFSQEKITTAGGRFTFPNITIRKRRG